MVEIQLSTWRYNYAYFVQFQRQNVFLINRIEKINVFSRFTNTSRLHLLSLLNRFILRANYTSLQLYCANKSISVARDKGAIKMALHFCTCIDWDYLLDKIQSKIQIFEPKYCKAQLIGNLYGDPLQRLRRLQTIRWKKENKLSFSITRLKVEGRSKRDFNEKSFYCNKKKI